jgi:hypothetical protein
MSQAVATGSGLQHTILHDLKLVNCAFESRRAVAE